MEKVVGLIKNRISAETLFFIAFISRLIIATWDTTMFPQVGILRKVSLLLVLICATTKIALYDSFSIDEMVGIGIVGAAILIQFITTRSNVLLITLLLVVAAKNIDFNKIMKVYLIIVGSTIGFAFICSKMEVIKNLRYWSEDNLSYRNSFGVVYCTDFAAHVFFLLLAYYYLRADKLKWYEYIVTAIIGLIVYKTTYAKLDSICILLLIILFGVGNAITVSDRLNKRISYCWSILIRCISTVIMFVSAIVMWILTMKYSNDIGWMATLDELITKRLSIANNTLNQYGIGLFGKKVELIGNGNVTWQVEGYNFVDCSYLYTALLYGVVIIVILMSAYSYMVYKNRLNIYLCYSVILIAINSMISHHLIDISYNSFIIGVLATGIIQERLKNDKENIQHRENIRRLVE